MAALEALAYLATALLVDGDRMTAGRIADRYDAFAQRLTARVLTDPWIDGRPRFREARWPRAPDRRALCARRRGGRRGVRRAGRLVRARRGARSTKFFALTPCQRLMWSASAPLWHGIARADVFLTDERPRRSAS